MKNQNLINLYSDNIALLGRVRLRCNCRRTYFYRNFIFYLSYFRQLPPKLTERNSTKTYHVFGRECDLKMHVQNLEYPFPKNRGPQNHLYRCFSTTSQLKGKFSSKYLRKETRYRKLGGALETTKGPLQFPEIS